MQLDGRHDSTICTAFTMPPRRATDVSESLRRTYRQVESLIEKVATAVERGEMTQRDLEIAIEGAFLRLCTTLESALEELFFGVLLGKLSHPTRIGVKPIV